MRTDFWKHLAVHSRPAAYRKAAVLGLALLLVGRTYAVPTMARHVPSCSADTLDARLSKAKLALAEERPAEAASLLRGTLDECDRIPVLAADYYAHLRVTMLAALAAHRAGDDAACRGIIAKDKGLRFLYGITPLEQIDEATAAILESTPRDDVALVFQVAALCPGEQRACAEPTWSNARQRAGEFSDRQDYKRALNIFYEAFARCAADPLDDQAYGPYAWAVSDAAFAAWKLNDLRACYALLRRDQGLRYVLGEPTAPGIGDGPAAEFAAGSKLFSSKLKHALRYNAKRCTASR